MISEVVAKELDSNDIVLNKIWNADLNGAVNHIKVAFNSCFKWLKDTLFKL